MLNIVTNLENFACFVTTFYSSTKPAISIAFKTFIRILKNALVYKSPSEVEYFCQNSSFYTETWHEIMYLVVSSYEVCYT